MKIAVAGDHAGFEMKKAVLDFLQKEGHTTKDFGAYSPDSSDYADFAHPLANAVESGEFDMGISLCGSGNGINMAANKHEGIRAALCWETEIAELARAHNNANICSLPARFLNTEKAVEIIDAFLKTDFEGGRHQRRIDKIPNK